MFRASPFLDAGTGHEAASGGDLFPCESPSNRWRGSTSPGSIDLHDRPVNDELARLTAALAGRYDIERAIGQGGMATVYLAHDVRHDRKVAVKVLDPELSAAIGAERFLAEIRVTAHLQHPNLLPLFDSGEAAGGLYYVMPFIEGESLRARLAREGQLPVDDALRIATAIGQALDYAHSQGVIHRDLKPENILLQAGQPIVADFGIALAVQAAGGARLTQSGVSVGTPQYMAPEQAAGEKRIDARVDVYALGTVLYEMLAGVAPFTGPNAQAVISRLMIEPPPSVRTMRPAVSAGLEQAVSVALAKLPADRWPTAARFVDALRSDTARRLPARGRARWRVWRGQLRQPLTMALAAVALLAILAFAWTLARAPRTTTGAAVADVVRFTVQLPPDLTNLGEPLLTAATVAISPDGRTVAFLADDATGTRRVYVRSLDDPTPRALPGTDAAYEPCFSPDGRWIAFWAAGKVQRVALDGGLPLTVGETSQVFGMTWPKSDLIVAIRERELAGIAPQGGPWKTIAPVDTAQGEQQQLNPVALPDGDHILYSSAGSTGVSGIRMAMVSLRTGRQTLFDINGAYPIGALDGQLFYVTEVGTLMAAPFDIAHGRITGQPGQLITGLVTGSAGTAQTAALSASGTLAYVVGSSGSTLVSVDMRGNVTTVEPGLHDYGYPRYSPDGSKIAYSLTSGGRTDVWIYDLASHTPTRLTTAGQVNERPEWTPDGKRVMFRSDEGAVRSSIWWAPVDQSQPPSHLLGSPRAYLFEAVMTPDAKELIYQVDTMGADIWYRSMSGDTTPRPIAATKAIENMARISPDGRWVAYSTDESGPYQVVVQPFPGPGPRVQVSVNGGTEPVWAHDGRRLFYRANRKIMVADLSTADGLTVTSRTALFDDDFELASAPHANYDVAPDDRHLLLLRSSDTPQMMLVHHWVDELRTAQGSASRR
jgi:eukaryotic-like serine/threonine-protein kinase